MHLADPLPVEEMYYNRSKDVSKPEWITVRGSSKLEGYHPHFHSVLPGTGYAPDTAGGTLTLFNAKWTVKRGIQNKGEPDTGTAEPWMQYNLAQLSAKLGLPTEEFSSIRVPSSTDEKFGVDFVPDNLDWLEAEKAEREGRAEVEPELSEEDERLLAANTLDALRFLGALLPHTACTCTGSLQREMLPLSLDWFYLLKEQSSKILLG